MGLLRHRCAVAHNWGWNPDLEIMGVGIAEINAEWECREAPLSARPLIVTCGPQINGSVTWLFGVDGSKEGWELSDAADILRDRFVTLCQRCRYTDVAVLEMGGDEHDFRTVFLHSTDKEAQA